MPSRPFPHLRSRLPDVASVAAAFADVLHGNGLAVSSEQTARFAAAVAALLPASTAEMYWIARSTLVDDYRDYALFRALFDQIFGGLTDDADRGEKHQPDMSMYTISSTPAPTPPTSNAAGEPNGLRPEHRRTAGRYAADDSQTDQGQDSDRPQMTSSVSERLGQHDFAACTPDELATLGRLIARLTVQPPMRRSRRRRRRSSGEYHDLRATLRRSHRTGGDPVRIVMRARESRPRRVVLLGDVSGSMEHYARAYLYLLHAAVRSMKAEAFVFSTRLTRVTVPLRHHQAEIALAAANRECADWSGGTRIAGALAAFLDQWGRRGMARGAVIVIVSDGWESGDPGQLAEQMERLARLAHRIVWVNPRKQSVAYQPLVGGMAAALPFVDRFVSGHSYAALVEVVDAIAER
jgi:uncharacterized protein